MIALLVLAQLNWVTVIDADRKSFAPYRECVIAKVRQYVGVGESAGTIALAARASCRSERQIAMIDFASNDLDVQAEHLKKCPKCSRIGNEPDEIMSDMEARLDEDVALIILNARTKR